MGFKIFYIWIYLGEHHVSLSDGLAVAIHFGFPNIMVDVLYNDKFVGFRIVFHNTSSTLSTY